MIKTYVTFFDKNSKAINCCELDSIVNPKIGQHYNYKGVNYKIGKVLEGTASLYEV